MLHVVVDLEMNSVSREHEDIRSFCLMETIEIGAVVLDDQYHEIGSFMSLVKPQLNDVIEKRYERLTKIKTEMVQNAPVFEDALNTFFAWCDSLKGDVQLYQWSENDLMQITREIAVKNIQVPEKYQHLLENWQDFQKEYGEKLGVKQTLSLKKAVMYAGIEFEGYAHDALFDARNTATLLGIVRTPELYQKALANIADVLNPKPLTTSIGALFNFSEFEFAS